MYFFVFLVARKTPARYEDSTIIPYFFILGNEIGLKNEIFFFLLFMEHPFQPLEYDVIENKSRRNKIFLHSPCGKTREVSMTCCNQGNNMTLWILIALLVLGSKDGIFCSNVFNGCGLPIIIALLYCLYKNGTLAGILTPSCNCGCNCGCHCGC